MSQQILITPERRNSVFRKFLRIIHFRAFATTFRTMLRVPVTDIYHPVHRDHSHYPAVAHRYRGLLALSQDACTGCKKCERICPNNTIIMETRLVNGIEHRFPGYFAGRCMLCGLCEEVCDRQWAIRHTDQFEDAAYTRDQIYYGPERMFEMWDKHIEPRIQANIAHKAVPDKKRATRESLHAWPQQRSETPVPLSKEERAAKTKAEAEKAAKRAARASAKKKAVKK
ncbi:MAG: 4Fe-4S binding protein [Candidatus Heimdallarchaeota archaeon]|nr:4Fe-4S binding protein [Candidatus Heimdallarchaeota archaeon]